MIEDEIKHAVECTICKQVARQPVVSGCCQRLVGCKDCLDMWLAHSPVCPLCKGNSIITAKMELKGFDDLLALFQQGTSEDRIQALSASQGRGADDDDFESLKIKEYIHFSLGTILATLWNYYVKLSSLIFVCNQLS